MLQHWLRLFESAIQVDKLLVEVESKGFFAD